MDIKNLGSPPSLQGYLQSTPTLPQKTQERAAGGATGSGNTTEAFQNTSATAITGNETTLFAGNEEAFRQKLQESVDNLNDFIQPQNTTLNFSIDEDNGKVIVKVTDKETNEVIKQIPSEEALELAKALDKLRGLLVHQQA